ncbi:hypothetical protein [Acetivibrio cellulolyticus]|uniref:hypothetical protein n=1 Tax=Acetivibrio cellulolyticus TaxID=35830 RepID=UPI0001E2BDD1|nr:hypothetical protein [Acetivibrio cellulolyticus]
MKYLSDLIPEDNEKRKIISCKNVTIRGAEFIQITFEDNQTILVRYDEKHKTWVTFYFTPENSAEKVKRIKDFVRNYL